MLKRSFFRLPVMIRRYGPVVLAVCFLLGHFLGVWFSGSASDLLFPTMRAVVSSRVSISGLLLTMALPLLISAFAVYVQQPVLLIPIAFCEAFLFSYVGHGLCSAWSSAGWLMTGLCLSGRFAAMPLLYWYWLRSLRGRAFEVPVFGFLLGMVLLIGIAEYYLIVPFWASITTF